MHYSYNKRTCIELMRALDISLIHPGYFIMEGRQTSSHQEPTLTLFLLAQEIGLGLDIGFDCCWQLRNRSRHTLSADHEGSGKAGPMC
jgi:hypothetical protein